MKRVLALLLGLLALGVGVYTLQHSPIYDDDFYSYCIREVTRGQVPYRDFPFLQPPLLLYVYAPFFWLLGPSVELGRWVSLGLATLGVGLTLAATRRQAGSSAALVAGLLIATNLPFLHDVSTLKTQPLTVACLGLVLVGLNRWWLGTLGAVLAVLSRASMVPVPCLLALYYGRRRGPASLALSLTLLGGAWLVWSQVSGGRMLYDLYGSHRDLASLDDRPWLVLKSLFVRSWLANQAVLCALVLLSLGPPWTRLQGFLAGVWLSCSAVHSWPPPVTPAIRMRSCPGARCWWAAAWGRGGPPRGPGCWRWSGWPVWPGPAR